LISATTDSVGLWTNARILSVDLASGDTIGLGSGVFARQLADGRLLTVAANGDVFVASMSSAHARPSDRIAIGRVAVTGNTGKLYPQVTVANDGTVAYVGGVVGLVRLTWLDANGRVVERRATQGNLWGIELSPDGARVAYADRVDERTAGARQRGLGDVWVEDLRTGARTKLTSEDFNVRPSWSPDGRSVLYTRIGRLSGLIERRADASLPEHRIVASQWFKHSVGDGRWLPDHRTLLVRTFANPPDNSRNIYAATVSDSTVRPIVVSAADEVNPTPSPDGTLLAYNSDESGVSEVYVQPFPSGQGRLQVSRGGGGTPRWARDGRHLYYWDARLRLVIVTLQTQPQLAILSTREIQTDAAPGEAGAATNVGYDIAPDGRVLIAESVTNSYQLILIRNGLSAPKRGDAP
jgi:Tol biopolymer transport system component